MLGTAASISAEIVGVPAGVIAIWSGSVASIPAGWVICDGTSSTPDLRDRFVIGAGSTYAVDATGGATTTASVAAHTHTLSGNTSNVWQLTRTLAILQISATIHTAFQDMLEALAQRGHRLR
jgi:microcystin-dependent protein